MKGSAMRIASLFAIPLAALLAVPALACDGHAPGHEPARHAMSKVSAWTSAEVLEVDLDDGTLALRHDRITAWKMAAMESMVFKARDAQQLARLRVGDKVTFRAGMVGTQPTIKDIKLAGK